MTRSRYEPRFTFRQASLAADFPLTLLRSYYDRGLFTTFAAIKSSQGKARKLTEADVVILAIASRLIDCGITPLRAFGAAKTFALVAKSKAGLGKRMPLELFDAEEYETLFVWDGNQARSPAVLPVPKGDELRVPIADLDEDFLSYGVGLIVIPLGGVIATVMTRLGISNELVG